MFLSRSDRHCFYRHSPDLLSQTYSFSLCVYYSDGVNAGCHPLRRQIYHHMFSREHSFSSLGLS